MRRIRLPKATRFRVLMRDEFQCQYCGATAETSILHVDHLVPVSHGGDHSEENLITACAACNAGKGATLLSKSSDAVLDAAATAFDRAQLVREMLREAPANPTAEPADAPESVVEQVETEAQALAISIAASGHKLAYIAVCVGKSVPYISQLQRGRRPIPERLVGPLCAATGSNLLRQVRDLHAALEAPDEVARLAAMLRAAA